MERPSGSTLVFSEEEVDNTIDAVFGASLGSPSPTRFAMGDIHAVDDKSEGFLKATSHWKDFLPHVERVMETERVASADTAGFVARMLRQRPDVYAVRYWEGLADTAALTAVLESIREAWFTSSMHLHTQCSSNGRATRLEDDKDGRARDDSKTARSQGETTVDKTSRASADGKKKSPMPPTESVLAASEEQAAEGRGDALVNTANTASGPRTAAKDGPGLGAPECAYPGGAGAANTHAKNTPARKRTLPEGDAAVSILSKRTSPVRVLGFSVGVMDCSRLNVALIAEWPGIGSLHDLLSGKVFVAQGVSQEDLVRWSRQIAEGLVHVSRRGLGGGVSRVAPTVSTKNAFLFPRPRDESQESADILDVKVATFLRACSIPGTGDTSDETVGSNRHLLPPEVLWANPCAIKTSSPTRCKVRRRQYNIDREAVDVWGIGTLIFELATGRVAGPSPLAYRQLRDLLRDVPIDPRFTFGDVARGVMRLALKRRPEERARAEEIAAVVEQIAARTLRRAHNAQDRQSRLKRERHRAAAEGSAGEETAEDGGVADDGYGKALAQWRIKEAVERAEGRAKMFLRQLWFSSLTEDEKRRIRHRRRHRKANKEAREWRRRRVSAAKMHHWTPAQVASWISYLLRKAEAARKLRLLASGNAKDAPLSVENDSKKEATSGVLRRKGDGIADANPEVVDSAAASSAAPCPEIASVLGGVSSDTHLTSVDEEPAAADEVAASVGQGIDDLGTKGSQDNRDTVKAPGKNDHPGQGKAYNNGDNDDDDDDGDEHSDDQDDNNGSGSSDDGGTGSNDWADVEASERTGYAGAAVEPFAVKEGINGASVMEAMNNALRQAEDAVTRFVKSSTRLARPAEVEKKRVDLMVRELLTIRPYSVPSQIKMRALAVEIVRSAEAPRNLTEDEISAQLPPLARVLTAGYRSQAAMVEQGREFAAARIQGLARGKHIRRVVSSIWRQAEEYARNIVQGEREARMKKEKEQRQKEKEEALERERQEAARYRLRLVPRVSSVTCRSMTVSLPPFLVAAARGVKRFLVVETTVTPPPPPRQLPRPPPHGPEQAFNGMETAGDGQSEAETLDSISSGTSSGGGGERFGVHVLLRQGAAAELKAASDKEPTTLVPTPDAATTAAAGKTPPGGGVDAPSTTSVGIGPEAVRGATRYLREVGGGLSLSGLRPCTTYRLTMEVPPIVRNDLLESARSLGVAEAVLSLEAVVGLENDHGGVVSGGGDDGTAIVGGSAASSAAHLDVETLPDVPDEVPLVTCKVLTSASAIDPRDPAGVLSLRQWQSPYPGVQNMDGPPSKDYAVLAPGRPEPLVSLQWKEPESNGLQILGYTVERRIGCTGAWKKIRARGGAGAGQGGLRRSPDAVDAPLRTISVDVLRKVAIHGLVLAYRVYPENVLGAGSPSKPVAVNLRAFLGHLRAQGGSDRTDPAPNVPGKCAELEYPPPSMPPVRESRSSPPPGRGGLLAVTTTAPIPASTGDGDGDLSRAAGDIEETLSSSSPTSPSKPLAGRTSDPELERQGQEPGTSSDGIVRDEKAEARRTEDGTKGATPYAHQARDPLPSTSAASPPAAYGGDFMGLGGFGEARVHSLFAPPSSSCRRRRPRRHARAPAAGGVIGDQHLHYGGEGGSSGGHRPYPLPPIVLATGVSGENRGSTISANYKSERGDGNLGGAFIAGMEEDQIDGSGPTTTNDVFHAFINLGRRLPGRLRRSPDR